MGDTRCVAGCYRCLLSYYNQPEHEIIDRRNEEALDILIALAKSDIKPMGTDFRAASKPAGSGRTSASAATNTNDLSAYLDSQGIRQPDELDYSVMDGSLVIDALYRAQKLALLKTAPTQAQRDWLADKGYTVIILGESLELLPKRGAH
jgi:hypothetical protein